MDIFATYYPPSLVDWWMDDWATQLYGMKRYCLSPKVTLTAASRTRVMTDVKVGHETKHHGRRYKVDHANGLYLKVEVRSRPSDFLMFGSDRPRR
jgi:hypothetical protein